MKGNFNKKYAVAVAIVLAAAAGALAFDYEGTLSEKKENISREPYKIMIASDLHYISPELTDNGSFFTELVRSGDGKTAMYSEEIADAMIDAAAEEKPDVFVISGDLTFNGEKKSHMQLAEKLQTLKEKGICVVVIPGNHDIENPQAAKFAGDGYEKVSSVSAEEFNDIYYSLSTGSSIARDTDSLSYIYESVKGVRVLMLDVNANSMSGAVSDKTMSWLETQLKKAQRAGAPVIAVSHQNLLAHNEVFKEGYVIGNAGELEALYEKYHVLCNLSGHMHLQHVRTEAPVPEIVTGAISSSPHYYGILTYWGDKLDYEAKKLEVDEVEDFSSWSEEFFKDISREKTLAELETADGAASEKRRVADVFASLNYFYFAGRCDLISQMEGLEELKAYAGDGTFLGSYIKSILADDSGDNTKATIRL